jgi:hypothetical protein
VHSSTQPSPTRSATCTSVFSTGSASIARVAASPASTSQPLARHAWSGAHRTCATRGVGEERPTTRRYRPRLRWPTAIGCSRMHGGGHVVRHVWLRIWPLPVMPRDDRPATCWSDRSPTHPMAHLLSGNGCVQRVSVRMSRSVTWSYADEGTPCGIGSALSRWRHGFESRWGVPAAANQLTGFAARRVRGRPRCPTRPPCPPRARSSLTSALGPR